MEFIWIFHLAVVALSTLASVHGVGDTGTKIFGGVKTPVDQYRYNVWIEMKKTKTAICGGSLIDRKWVLTAASCLMTEQKKRKYRVVLGDYNRDSTAKKDRIKPAEFFIHPAFNRTTLDNNIALIELNKKAPNKNSISIVPRLATDDLDNDIASDDNCYMTGWGQKQDGSSPKRLQYLPVRVESPVTCSNLQNDSTELCYSGAPGGACPTDEGNPIMCVIDKIETQVGVHSRTTCTGESTGATKVSAFKPWIDGILNQPETCGSPPKTENGKYIADSRYVGDDALLSCKAGHRPSAPTSCDAKVTCLEGGLWSGPTSSCISECSSEGTSFMFGYIRNAFAEGNLYLYITAARPTDVVIDVPFLDTILNVRVKSFGQFKLASSLAGVGNMEKSNKGIHVRSDRPISVYMHSYRPGNGPSADGSLISPESCLSTYYTVIAHDQGPDDSIQAALIVVATVNDTTVVLQLSDNPTDVLEINLNRFDTYHLTGSSLEGRVVYATHPVALLVGHECANVPNKWTEKCDHIVEQLAPDVSAGTHFIVTGLVPRPNYSVRILATKPDTNVKIWDNVENLLTESVLAAGRSEFYNFTNAQTVAITSDKGIHVAQFGHGNTSDTLQFGDPCMVIVPALNEFLNNYLVYTPTPPDLYNVHWVAIVMSTCYDLDGISINDELVIVREYVTVPGQGVYAIYHVELAEEMNEISHTDPSATFGVIQYGFNSLVGYAWVAGRSYLDL